MADAFRRGDVLVVDACEVVQKMMRENRRSYNPLISARRRLCLAGLSLAVGMAAAMGPAAPLALAEGASDEVGAPIESAVVTADAGADGPSSSDASAEPAEAFKPCGDVPGSSDGGVGSGLPVSDETPDGSASDLEGPGMPAGEASDPPSTPSSKPSDEPGDSTVSDEPEALDSSPATEREGDCSDAPDGTTDSATLPADDLPTDASDSRDEADASPSSTDAPAASGKDHASDSVQAPEPVEPSNDSPAAGEPRVQSIQQGWLAKDGNRYYLGKDGKPLVGEQKVDGAWYYFDPEADGAMRTGFIWLPDAKAVACYDLKTGKKLLGEQSVHGSTHYFDPKTGAMRTGITTLPKTKAHAKEQACFDEFDGSMITGEATVSGKTYYFDQGTGGMVRNGWRSVDGGLYAYYGGDGTIVRGEKWIDGERYWFDADSGRASLAQFLRWNLSHASGAAGAACFNGLNLTAGQLSGVNAALAGFSNEGYSAGFVIMDLKTGKGLSGNADGVFYSASTVKAPYIASVYQGAFHNSVEASAPWYSTLDEICVWSDNYQYAYLRSAFGNQVFADWLSSVGVDEGKAAHNYAWYSARDLGKMWLGMYDYFQNGGPAGGQLASLLSHGFGSSIYMELGGEYSVSSKGGWYPTLPGYTATGDGGIVRSKTGDYLVVVLSNAPERFDLTRALVRALDNAHKLF